MKTMSQKLVLIVIISVVIVLIECGKCPKEEHKQLIHPCICENNNSFRCDSSENFNLKRIFEYISPTVDWRHRKFKSLTINASQLTELEEISFLDTVFEEIVINNGHKLQRIHTNALGASRMHIKRFTINSANQLKTFSPDYNLFHTLSSMNNIASIDINGVNINEIPDFAFKPLLGGQWDLKNISIKGSIKRIGNYAFYDFPYWLKEISLGNQINYISGHAFDMRSGSFERVTIDLADNQLNANSFESQIFMNSKRTLYVDLARNQLTHLDEFIFKPFLKQNIMNQINVLGNPFICDCRMKWLLKNKPNFEKQVLNAICSDGKQFWSHSVEELNECLINDNVIVE